MASEMAVSSGEVSQAGTSVFLTRWFGWATLAVLAVFLINNYLTHWLGLPGADAAIMGAEGAGAVSWIQALAYPLAIGIALLWVLKSSDIGLRSDSVRVSNMNAYLIRALFFGVVFVGIADAVISFMRVEGLLPVVFGEALALDLGKSQFRGPFVHMPLLALGFVLAIFVRTLGFTWLALFVVAAELLIVISRFIFSYEQSFMGDLVRFWYAALFLFASAHTLLEEGHVRVDVFYSAFAPKKKGKVNAFGSIFLGMVMCWVILVVGMEGPASVINAPMLNFETTQTGFGMYVKYLMAGFLGVFAVSMMIQFTSYMMEAVADIRGEPGGREHVSSAAH